MDRRDRGSADVLGVLAELPCLEPVALHHLEPIRRFGRLHAGYADFDATAIWAWSAADDEGFRVARAGENLVLELGDYVTGERVLSFLGTDAVDETARRLLDLARDRGLVEELRLVPEVTAALLDRSRWEVVEDRDQFDYVYDLDERVRLEGRAFGAWRTACNAVDRSGLTLKVDWLSAAELGGTSAEVLDVFDAWASARATAVMPTRPERVALAHLLATCAEAVPAAMCQLVYEVETEQVLYFAICEPHTPSTVLGHFSKWRPAEATRHLPRWAEVRAAGVLREMGYRYINEEQDLGLPGLRLAKELGRPASMRRKYRVRRAGGG